MAEGDFVSDDDPFDQAAEARKAAEGQDEATLEAERVRNALRYRMEAYRRVFSGKAAEGDIEAVTNDLKTFCRAEASTFHTDDRVQVLLTGRQEVWLRIMDHTRLDLDTMYLKYTNKPQG